MPTVREYSTEKGYYVRSNIDGRFVTLQLSPEAEGLIAELGFQDDDQVSWQFLMPLCDSGHAYTNNSGTEVATDAIDADVSISGGHLSAEKKRRLEEFLEQHTPDETEIQEESPGTETTQPSSRVEEIDGARRSFIEKWSPTDDEYEATLNRIARANDLDGILKSIANHSTHHPMMVDRFRLSSQEVPTYSFETYGIAWTVHDFRTVNKVGTDAELFFDIQPGTTQSQSVTIEPETTEWHTTGNRFTEEQVSDFLTVVPDIVHYLKHLGSGPKINPQKLIANPTADLTPDLEDRIQSVAALRPVDPGQYGRVLGAVLTLGEKGYGRVRGHTGHTFPFSTDDVEAGRIEPGDVVTFEVKPHRKTIYADAIKPAETEIPASEVIRNWPDLHEKSLSELQETWHQEEPEDKPQSQLESVRLPGSENDSDGRCIQIDVDSLAFYLVASTDETATVVDNAVRTLLKNTIDGSNAAPQAPVATTELELWLPNNLRSIIDSVVETSSKYETRDQFINTALQQELDGGEQVELTVSLSSRYHTAVQQITDDSGESTSDFVRAAIENALITELQDR